MKAEFKVASKLVSILVGVCLISTGCSGDLGSDRSSFAASGQKAAASGSDATKAPPGVESSAPSTLKTPNETPDPTANVVKAAAAMPVGATPGVAALKWNLDRDCISEAQTQSATTSSCNNLTNGKICPVADPGGTVCNEAASYCRSINGYRRFKCY